MLEKMLDSYGLTDDQLLLLAQPSLKKSTLDAVSNVNYAYISGLGSDAFVYRRQVGSDYRYILLAVDTVGKQLVGLRLTADHSTSYNSV